MRLVLAPAATALCLLASGPALAQGDPERGQALSAPCATCHGSDGIAPMPIYPNLAGQNAPYLVNALKAYRDGHRAGSTAALMIPMAKQLSDQDMEDLAAYYSAFGRQ